ncbi:uncharacterized protein LOC124254100 [Haliotis rubra]|uniref:uncharacterized protein LOC124254100 n=1 Tax=Haliotis rubra TaxID=36100 RepID=UPI001EE4F902|nr:uncharacterized protein LOC124254100 [Haliotis rubra]
MMESRLLFKLAIVAAMVTLSVQLVTPPPNACGGRSSFTREYYPINGRCDRFYRCLLSVASPAMQCRLGTFFSYSKQTCDYAKNVIQDQSCDLCSGRNVHPFMDSCELFYECTGNSDTPVEAKCCPAGQIFVENVGCQPLGFGQSCAASNYTHSRYCRNYLQCVDGTLTQFCCPGTERFNGERCVPDPDGVCTLPCEGEEYSTPVPDSTRIASECEPGTDSELNNIKSWGMMDLNSAWMENDGPVTQSSDGQSGVFRNGAYITLSFFNNNVMPPFRAFVRFQPEDPNSNIEQDLLSNACDGADASITLSVIPDSRTVRVSVGDSTGTSTSAQWNPSFTNDPWVEVTVQFANQNLLVTVKNGESQVVQSNIAFAGSITNNCKPRVCPMVTWY